jgi:hypothetical protein
MTDQELKDLVASLAISQRQTDKQLKELGKQIGGIGNKFGCFTEGMAFPALEKTLRDRFGMENISFRNKRQKEGELLELDILAYSNGVKNEVFVVEIKSHLLQREFAQILNTMHLFAEFFPEHHDKTLYGMVAVVDTTKELKQKILDEGLYLALIHDDQFTLKTPKNFKPKAFYTPNES